jgi:hypothetical protein
MELSTRPVPRSYNEENLGNQVSSVRKAAKERDSWKRFGREPPLRKDLSEETEESPLLEAVTSKHLVKTLQPGAKYVEISDGAIIKWNYELCVKVVIKSNIRSETPSRVTLTRDDMHRI